MADAPQREPGGPQSALLALLVHVLFFAFLFFAVSWRTEPPQGMVAELWTSLPATQPAPPPVPPEVKPEPPKPVPEPPKPEPPKAVEPPKPQPKPDIALKEKAEQEKKRREEERKRAEDERKKKEEADKRRLEQQKAAEAEKTRREQLAQLAREQEVLNQKLEAQSLAAAAQSRLIDDYTSKIKAKIQRYVVMPAEIPGNPEAQFDVVLLPSGEVLSVRLKKSSGHPAYDAAVERAILKAQPLPLPPDPSAFSNFRNLVLKFRPLE